MDSGSTFHPCNNCLTRKGLEAWASPVPSTHRTVCKVRTLLPDSSLRGDFLCCLAQSLGELIPKDRVCELLGLCKSEVRGGKREGKPEPEPWRMVAANLWGEVGQRLGLEQREA